MLSSRTDLETNITEFSLIYEKQAPARHIGEPKQSESELGFGTGTTLMSRRSPRARPFRMREVPLYTVLGFAAARAGDGQSPRVCLRPVVYSSLVGFTSCIVKSFKSCRSFISSPLWTPDVISSVNIIALPRGVYSHVSHSTHPGRGFQVE